MTTNTSALLIRLFNSWRFPKSEPASTPQQIARSRELCFQHAKETGDATLLFELRFIDNPLPEHRDPSDDVLDYLDLIDAGLLPLPSRTRVVNMDGWFENTVTAIIEAVKAYNGATKTDPKLLAILAHPEFKKNFGKWFGEAVENHFTFQAELVDRTCLTKIRDIISETEDAIKGYKTAVGAVHYYLNPPTYAY